jgi:hypothetical protein
MYCRGNPIKYSDPSGYEITLDTPSDPKGKIFIQGPYEYVDTNHAKQGKAAYVVKVKVENTTKKTLDLNLEFPEANQCSPIPWVKPKKLITSNKNAFAHGRVKPGGTVTLEAEMEFDSINGDITQFWGKWRVRVNNAWIPSSWDAATLVQGRFNNTVLIDNPYGRK